MSAVIENQDGYLVLAIEGSTEKIWALNPLLLGDEQECPDGLEPLTADEVTVRDQQRADGFEFEERTLGKVISGKKLGKMQLKYRGRYLYLYEGQEDLSLPFERARVEAVDLDVAVKEYIQALQIFSEFQKLCASANLPMPAMSVTFAGLGFTVRHSRGIRCC